MPKANALPVEPTNAKAVIVVPNTLINSMNGPIDWLATKKSLLDPRNIRLDTQPSANNANMYTIMMYSGVRLAVSADWPSAISDDA